jgi:drug/metabolite transporter (DMT)-like permease
MTVSPVPFASGMALALSSAVFYGVQISFARMAANDGVSGPLIVGWRTVLMIVVALGVMAVLRTGPAVPREDRRAVAGLSIASALVALCYVSSVAFIPVTVAAVIFYTFPVLIVLSGPWVDGRPLTMPLIGVALLAFAGVVLVVGPALSDLDPRGVVLASVASLSATWQFHAGARARRSGTIAKLFWVQVAMLPLAVAAAMASSGTVSPASFAFSPLAVALTIGLYVVALALQLPAMTRVAPAAAGLAFCAEPVVSAISSTLLLGERLSGIQYVGGSLVVAAIIANVAVETRAVSSRARTAEGRE